MSEIRGLSFPVHHLGLVRVIDCMGDDNAIVQMARVSYGEGTKTVNEDRGLIRYLMRHRHTSPFEGCVIKLHLKMPIFIARQWVRHRTASLNEVSARYSEMKDEFYVPSHDYIQPQSLSNKQGREESGLSQETQERFEAECKHRQTQAYISYKNALDAGIARETARINLPVSLYTEFYWQMNLHNLLHFCSLRSDAHAQREIRDYSDIILHQIVKLWVPHTYEAFNDYVMNAATFSAQELQILHKGFDLEKIKDEIALLPKREQDEFNRKMRTK